LILGSLHFEEAASGAPPGTVFLNVYDLWPEASLVNSLLCNTLVKSIGAFHTAVEVHGHEWSFFGQTGICLSESPRSHPVHVYRQSLNLGVTSLNKSDVNRVVQKLKPLWPSRRYNVFHSNCIHFSEDFLRHLCVGPVPAWVRGLHETGEALLEPVRPALAIAANMVSISDAGAGDAKSVLSALATPKPCIGSARRRFRSPSPHRQNRRFWSAGQVL